MLVLRAGGRTGGRGGGKLYKVQNLSQTYAITRERERNEIYPSNGAADLGALGCKTAMYRSDSFGRFKVGARGPILVGFAPKFFI